MMVAFGPSRAGVTERGRMAFGYRNGEGTTYYLHGRVATLRNDRKLQIYVFSKTPEDALDQLPDGHEVAEARTSGLPLLKKKAAG
jgi:hypothetical protein